MRLSKARALASLALCAGGVGPGVAASAAFWPPAPLSGPPREQEVRLKPRAKADAAVHSTAPRSFPFIASILFVWRRRSGERGRPTESISGPASPCYRVNYAAGDRQ